MAVDRMQMPDDFEMCADARQKSQKSSITWVQVVEHLSLRVSSRLTATVPNLRQIFHRSTMQVESHTLAPRRGGQASGPVKHKFQFMIGLREMVRQCQC